MARILLVLPLLGGAAGSASSPRGLRGAGMLMGTCEEGESVTCPGSGVSCAGNQCCPPIAASGNLTFPCPSASDSVQGCGQSAKLFDCLVGTCKPAESVRCPGSNAMCAGDQCCPGTEASGGQTFPCPSASNSFQGCGSGVKVSDCLATFTVVAANTGCRNFASLPEIARFPGSVSNVFCAQKCAEMGCSFWTYQDEPNNVCEAQQPHPKPLQPALGDDACILFGGQCQKEENACWDVVLPSTPAPAPAPSPFLVLSPNTGCKNFASLREIARFPEGVSNVFCAQKCAEMGCSFWTYQDEPNNVCEGLQPHPKPLQPALGDDACILFVGQCQKEENACWDVVTLSAPPAPSPPLFTVLSPNTGCKNFASLPELGRFKGVSNVFCAQACAVTKGCNFWTYQDDTNAMCEAQQPFPKPAQPALADDSCILFGGQCLKEENACWDVVTLSAPPAPSPPLFTVLSPNTGCKNFASLPELGRFKAVSNVFCAQACAVTKGCGFWTYQDDENAVCEAQQPFPKPLQPALADDSCILFGGQCLKEENACWDVVTLSAPPAPSPPLFTVLSPNTGCKNFASLPELGRFKAVSNVFCAQACAVTKGCGFWTYQDDKNAVCEAQQPYPKPLQPALADDSCILFGGQCLKENNACWDLVVLSA